MLLPADPPRKHVRQPPRSLSLWPLDKGILKPHLSATYAFGEMAQAHTQVEGGRTVGKVVVIL